MSPHGVTRSTYSYTNESSHSTHNSSTSRHSMPDFADLMDSSMPLFEPNKQPRRQTSPDRANLMGRAGGRKKQPSISLATGLIMNKEGSSPPRRKTSEVSTPRSEKMPDIDDGGSLFYAYALKSDYTSSPPAVLTFASAATCAQWWAIVQREYPSASRPGSQLFVLKSEDLSQISENSKFKSLRNMWFLTTQDNPDVPASIIPLQSADGQTLTAHASQVQAQAAYEMHAPSMTAIDSLTAKLDKLVSIVEDNTQHIHLLSVAQSAGLQRMQQINESTTTDIKMLNDTQRKLQSLVEKNASHYIALSNSTFQTQEQMKNAFSSSSASIRKMVESQTQMSKTCGDMLRGIETLGSRIETSVTKMSENLQAGEIMSDEMYSAMAQRIAPPPRKLNRRIRGVWYEYDPDYIATRKGDTEIRGTPKKLNVSGIDAPGRKPGAPRKLTGPTAAAITPPTTPKAVKAVKAPKKLEK